MARHKIGSHMSQRSATPLAVPLGMDSAYEKALGAAKIWQARRRLRHRFVKESLLGDTAWDLLLELFIRSERSEVTNIFDLSSDLGSPLTTTIRWVGALRQSDLAVIEFEEKSNVTERVGISEYGKRVVVDYFLCAQDAERLLAHREDLNAA